MRMKFLALLAVLGASAHASDGPDARPVWIDALIAKFEAADVANPPLGITRFTYHDAPVYFVPAHCCDIPSQLYDADGNALCAPDGGFTGRGDGRCPDFYQERRDEQLIWRDSRDH
jgi:hypothetical protein